MRVEPDHLVVVAQDLRQGCDWVEERLGVRPQPGGKHVAMGTHNALLSLGSALLSRSDRRRSRRRRSPRGRAGSTWTSRGCAPRWPKGRTSRTGSRAPTTSTPPRRAFPNSASPTPMARGDLTWRITIPDDGHRPGRGLVPTLIQWPDARHPTDRMTDSGCRLVAIAGEHPEPATVRARTRDARTVRHDEGHLRQIAADRRDDPHVARRGDAVMMAPSRAGLFTCEPEFPPAAGLRETSPAAAGRRRS